MEILMTEPFKDELELGWKGAKEEMPEFGRCVNILVRTKEEEEEGEEKEGAGEKA